MTAVSARPALRPRATARRTSVVVRAQAPTPPKGVTQPPVTPKFAAPKFGFVDNAEILNSRAAMLGFFGILAVEAIAGKGIFEMVGLTTGNGLPFDF